MIRDGDVLTKGRFDLLPQCIVYV